MKGITMLKLVIVGAAFAVSSNAFATSSYLCKGPKLSPMDADPVTIAWSVGTASPMPRRIDVGVRGALSFGDGAKNMETIDGFWFSSKRIWIHLAIDTKPFLILKALRTADNSVNEYKGEMTLEGKKHPVVCQERG
jgi:hypothetical protein